MRVSLFFSRLGAQAVAALVVAWTLEVQAGMPMATRLEQGGAVSNPLRVQTASTHPMKYFVSLPRNWSPDRKWPVLIAPSAHYDNQGKTIALFAAERDARKVSFIIVSPFVINADRVAAMPEYRGAVAGLINAADASTPDGFRDEEARGKFDWEGIRAVLKDIQSLYRGEDKVYIAGFSSSTHVAYMFLFAHPELLKGVVINSGVYLGRGVDEDHIPFMNSPARAQLEIKFIVGESDPHYKTYSENWLKAKAQLLRYGHPPSKLQLEVINKGNPEKLNPGHNWFPTRILDFCTNVELGLSK
jgi:hypothetical protein